MAKKRLGVEQIIGKLREAELLLAQGQTVPQAAKKIGVTEQTYYRWRKEYGGLRTDQAKRFKELEQENPRLKRASWPMPSWTRQFCERPHRDTSEPDQTARYGVEHVRDTLGRGRVSERRVCRVLGQPRATQRRSRLVPADEPRLVGRMTELACDYGRYGYRRITALFQHEG